MIFVFRKKEMISWSSEQGWPPPSPDTEDIEEVKDRLANLAIIEEELYSIYNTALSLDRVPELERLCDAGRDPHDLVYRLDHIKKRQMYTFIVQMTCSLNKARYAMEIDSIRQSACQTMKVALDMKERLSKFETNNGRVD